MQFVHCSFRFLDGLHLHERETFRALVMAIAYDLCVLHVSDTIEQFEEIALRGVERQVANVQPWRRNLNPFRLAYRPRWLRAIARLYRWFLFLAAVSEKFGNPLPERLFLCLRRFLRCSNPFVISSAPAPTA